MAKAKDDGLRVIEVTIGNRGDSAVASMSPVDGGKRVNLRPSDKVVGEMKARGVKSVRASWEVDANGQPQRLNVRPAKPGEPGIKVRYDVGNLRPHVHISTSDVGQVTAVGSSCICPDEQVNGDVFSFAVPIDMHFKKGETP